MSLFLHLCFLVDTLPFRKGDRRQSNRVKTPSSKIKASVSFSLSPSHRLNTLLNSLTEGAAVGAVPVKSRKKASAIVQPGSPSYAAVVSGCVFLVSVFFGDILSFCMSLARVQHPGNRPLNRPPSSQRLLLYPLVRRLREVRNPPGLRRVWGLHWVPVWFLKC